MNRGSREVRRLFFAAAGLVLLVAGPAARAHEGHRHQAMGTVKLVHEEHLQLTLQDGKDQTFVLSESTTYRRGETATTKEDVAVGERAVVTYETKEGADRALEVRLGERKEGS